MKKNIIILLSLALLIIVAGQLPVLSKHNIIKPSQSLPVKPEELVSNHFEDTIRIGIFEPLTGSGAEGGNAELEGMKLANKLYPAIGDTKIALYIEDNQSDRYKTVEVLNTLIDRNKVHAILGSWGSSFSLAAGPIINEERIPTIGASCTNPRITIGNKYYSRVSYIDTFQGTALANFAVENLGAKTAAVLLESDNEYSVDLGAYFTNAFAELHNYNQSILYEGYYQQGDTDYKAIIGNLKNLNPDIIFVPGNQSDVAQIAKAAREAHLEGKIIGTDTLDTNEFIKNAGNAANGVYFSTFYSTEISKTKESDIFLEAYRREYKKEPTSFSALGYDAYILLYNALNACRTTDSEKLNKAIHEAKNVEGATGNITMDINGDTKRPVVIKVINNQKATYVNSIDPIK